MDFQIREAIRLCNVSLNSTTIEWAMNIELCDSLSANPPIAAHLTSIIAEAMCGNSVRRASLSLSLVEMLIKNLGIGFIRFIDKDMCDAWEQLCLRKSSWRYSLTRNLFKVTQQLGTNDEDSTMWQQVMYRARGLLREASESLVLHEGEAPVFFRFYKDLRGKQVNFPPKSQGSLIRGGIEEEELPIASPDPPTPSSPSRPRESDSTPLRADEVDDLRAAVESLEGEDPTSQSAEVCRRLRPRLVSLIQVHADAVDSELDELMLEAMMALLSRLDIAAEPFAPPPPPEPAPAPGVAQENADFLFALTLQQQDLQGSLGGPFGRSQGMRQFPSMRQFQRHSSRTVTQARQTRAPPPRAMDTSEGYLINSSPPKAISGPAVKTSISHASSGQTHVRQGEAAAGSGANPLETSLLGVATPKKPKIWDQLRQLALSATAKTHSIGEAASSNYHPMNEEEGSGLIAKAPEGDPLQRGLLAENEESEDKEEDWDLVRTEKQTYWFNKRTLRSQWTAPRWAQRKAKQLKEL